MSLHVVPQQDEVDHELTDSCVRGPRDEPVVGEDGGVEWVVVHQALDGRV